MSTRKPSLTPAITIDLNAPVPAYRQIVDGIRMHLVDGTLRPGMALPSVRRLAMDLGVHFNTVADAYRELATEGWIDLRHGKVAVVLSRDAPAAPRREKLDSFRQRLRHLAAQMQAEGVSAQRIASELKVLAERFEP